MNLQDAVVLSLTHNGRFPQADRKFQDGRGQGVRDQDLQGSASPAPVRDAFAEARRALARAAELEFGAIPWTDASYPTLLSGITEAPPVLWTRGPIGACSAPTVAIVGSRAASPYAIEVAERLAADLSSRGITVVSGLARGVDPAAHRGALAGGGRTVAVLGSGLDIIYPSEHTKLAARIAAAGCLISELPPGTPPRRAHFPRRNRIISGLSLAIVVVEASDHSGSLITARYGLEQGREVMAVPGNVLSGRNRGSHALLKDGAKVVEQADDILQELGLSVPELNPRVSAARLRNQDPILRRLPPGEACDLDMLVDRTGLTSPKLLSRLFDLELKGEVRRVEGGRFVRADAKRVVT